MAGDEDEQMQMAMVVEKMNEYVETVVNVDPKNRRVRGLCVNKDETCAYWAATGSCENHYAYVSNASGSVFSSLHS